MVVVTARKWGHNMEVQEVHKLREHYRQVHSSIGLYIPSLIYLDLDFSPRVAATGMEGSYSLSLSCKL